jgi:N-acetylneuraminate lyase
MSNRLGGILPALVTPLKDDNSVSVSALEKLLERVYSAGVAGVYLCGSTGEGLLLSDEERQLVAEIAVANSPQEKQIVVHIGARSLESTLHLTRHACRLGVAGVSSLPMPGMSSEQLTDFYRTIAANATVPVVAYYFPALTGYELPFGELEKIAGIPGVQGIKYTDYNLYTLSLLAAGGTTIFNGRDEVLAAGLLMGAAGGIGSIYNIVPHKFVELFSLAKSSRWEEARKLQYRINELITLLLSYPLLPAIKQTLGWAGIECGATRSEPQHLTPEQQKQLRAQLGAFADLLPGLC